MSDSVSLSKAVRTNLLNLQNTASLMSTAQERLATGNKVNSALDNPTNFFTASSLNSKASDLSQLLDSVSNAVQTIEAADNGISAITDLVESAQATARQAKQLSATTTQTTTTVTAEAAFSGSVALVNDIEASASGSVALVNDVAAGHDGSTITGVNAADTADGVFGTGGDDFTISDGTNTHSIVFYDSNNSGSAGSAANTTYIDLYDGSSGFKDVSTVVGEINSALSGASIDATFSYTDSGADGALSLVSGNTTDSLTLTAGTSDALAGMGMTADTYDASNSVINTAVANGDTLTLQLGTAGAQTITFGNGVGEINSISGLNSALGGLTGITASVDGSGNIQIEGTGGEDVTIGGTAATSLGLTAGAVSGSNSVIDGLVSGGNTLTVTVGTGSAQTLTFGNGVGEIASIDDLNTALGNLTGVTASVDGSGNIQIEGTNGDSVTVGGTGASALGLTAGTQTATSTSADTEVPNAKRAALVSDYNELLTQIDSLAKDSGFNGVNLLNGDDLSVTFNEDGTSKLDIAGVTFDAAGLGLTALASTAFDDNADIDTTLDTLKEGIDTLRTQAAKFGSNLSVVQTRQDFTKEMINTLETGAANLTLADTNEEAANLLALQTRQQLSSTALSLASQADQQVLSLF